MVCTQDQRLSERFCRVLAEPFPGLLWVFGGSSCPARVTHGWPGCLAGVVLGGHGVTRRADRSIPRQPPCPYRRPWRQLQRLPSRDGPRTCPGLLIVCDAWEQPAQLDRPGEFSTLIEGGADCCGLFLRDDEHPDSMGRRIAPDKAHSRKHRSARLTHRSCAPQPNYFQRMQDQVSDHRKARA